MEKIPKKAYYIWIGGKEKKPIFSRCFDSWQKYLKDYEIIELNEKNLDMNMYMENKFFKQCFEKKLYAYCSDYIRCKYIYENGGIYLDTDMEILKPIDDLLKYDFFIGYESDKFLGVGLFGAVKKNELLKDMIDFYENEVYKVNLYTIPKIMTSIVNKKGYLKNENFLFLEKQYFYPYSLNENVSDAEISDKTYAMHHWDNSWSSLSTKLFLESKHLSGIKKIYKVIKVFFRHYLKGY